MKQRLLYISSIPLNESSGGSVVMFNHLKKRKDFEVLEINNQIIIEYKLNSYYGRIQDACWNRINRTRVRNWIEGFNQLDSCWRLPLQLEIKIKEFNPNLVMTVAHGNLFWLANKLAKKEKIPLISIYHDWWPTLVQQNWNLTNKCLTKIEERFRQLYHDSDCALCISEGMHQKLGDHRRNNAHILYPLTNYDLTSLNFINQTEHTDFKIVYSGKINHSYGKMLQQLIKVLPKNNSYNLRIYGNNSSDWSNEIREQAISQKILQPFIPLDQYVSTLAKASALLTVVSFDESVSQLMSTNFPSKLTTYAAFSKPLIVWAPAYSIAAQFVKKNDVALLIEDPNPEVLIQSINELANSPQWQQELIEKARKLHLDILNPNKIHGQFVRHITNLCTA